VNNLRYLALACFALSPVADTFAQANFPDRPIRLIMPFPPGGATDANARVFAREMEPVLGQPIVIDNRGGANAVIGSDIVAKAAPNGYTLMYVSAALVINPALRKNLPYDTERDFTPITNPIVGQGSMLTVHSSLPVRTVPEFIALAKRQKLTFASPGVGNVLHLIAEGFNARAGIKLTHVPYKGAGPVITALLGGEVHMAVVPPIVGMPHFKSEKLRPIAYSGTKRLAALPDVPTAAEGGLPGFAIDTGWQAWFAPAKTPDAIVQRIYGAIKKSLEVPKVRDYLAGGGYDIVADPPAVFQKNFPNDIKRWAEIVKIAGIMPE